MGGFRTSNSKGIVNDEKNSGTEVTNESPSPCRVEQSRTLQCARALVWLLTSTTLLTLVLGVFYIQFTEINTLRQRVQFLEDSFVESRLMQAEVQKRDIPERKDRREHHLTYRAPGDQCCLALAKPTISGNPTEAVFVYGGQDVLLPCNASGYPPPSIRLSPATDPTGNGRYVQVPGGLQINNVMNSDARNYTCTVENIFGKQQKIIELHITDPVVATTSPSRVTSSVGDNFSIHCDVSGVPPPKVIWQHVTMDGKTVPMTNVVLSAPGRYTLTFANANHVDAGTYICKAFNAYETDQAQTTVTVSGAPQITNPPPRVQSVIEGTTVTLRCDVLSDPPATVTWTYPLTGNKSPLNGHVNPDNSITLSVVDKYNSGTYSCTASNAAGTVIAMSTLNVEQLVHVNAGPHLVPMTGSESFLNFQCAASGEPSPSVTWSKMGSGSLTGNAKYIQLPGGNLVLTNPALGTDTGVYVCMGENHNGNDTDTVLVYKDLGALSCFQTFDSVSCPLGQTCGGSCPDCTQSSEPVYGYQTYSGDSAICRSSIHAGTVPNVLNMALWTSTGASGPLSTTTSHGVISMSKQSAPSTATVVRPATYSRVMSGASNLFG
ncbi:hemicentin-1-like [Mya arenaria]|uniref:hemicentin-1-like n=1 Tax=Mya arenaria TaxID=6604 RepID=UPI0022E53F7A|nr:hemicentin-1-like [Mya arenaria]